MHVEIIAENGGCGCRVGFVFFGQLLKSVKRFAVDDGALFNPSNLILFGLYFKESPPVLQNLQSLPIRYLGHAL